MFKSLSRSEAELLVKEFVAALGSTVAKLSSLQDEADERENDKLADSVMDLDSLLFGIRDEATDFLRRRASWKSFAFALEDLVDDLESEVEEIRKYHTKVRPLVRPVHKIAADFLAKIDTGNRQEAEDAATGATAKCKKNDASGPL